MIFLLVSTKDCYIVFSRNPGTHAKPDLDMADLITSIWYHFDCVSPLEYFIFEISFPLCVYIISECLAMALLSSVLRKGIPKCSKMSSMQGSCWISIWRD